jgi:CRISPR-associated protein Csb2
MSVVIEVDLLAGRYHAHLWGQAQFAMAEAEWPPSPWRLLRALTWAWFDARPRPSSEGERDDLITKLALSCPPEIWLPVTAFNELRFYQPLEHNKRALHHDFFAVPRGGSFYFAFDADLSPDQERLLRALLSRLRYFGRAESRAALWVSETLREPPRGFHRVVPRDRANGFDWIPRRVLCPTPDRAFKPADLWAVRPVQSGTKRKQSNSVGEADTVPIHLVDALIDARKPLPDGATWVEYAQPVGSLVYELPRRARSRPPEPSFVETKSVVLRLCRRIPIPLAETVAIARAYREAVVDWYRTTAGGPHSLSLTGRQEDGSIDRTHRHLYYLPQPAKGTTRLDALIVRVPADVSLSQLELDALLRVERVVLAKGDRYPITLVPEQINDDAEVASARHWKSLTPFLAPHNHRLRRDSTSPDSQLVSFIENLCTLTPTVELTRGPAGAGERTAVCTHLYGVGRDGLPAWRFTRRLGHWFILKFDRPIALPMSVGTDSHFGLGQFAPDADG